MSEKKIAVGCDHAALEFKAHFIEWLDKNGYIAVDCGCYSEESIDYPDIAREVCRKITSGECEKGILICGTGIGMSIAANKVKGIRAAVCCDCYSTKYTRLHNDANVACFGARTMGEELAKELLAIFLSTEFEGGGRHERRVAKLTELENE